MPELDLLPALRDKAASGDEVAVFEALLASIPASAKTGGTKSTVATRKLKLREAIESFDLDRLIALQDTMTKIVDVITKNELNADGGILPADLVDELMGEFLDEREIAEVLDVRREMIKEAVFSHLDEVGELMGEEDPASQNGTVESPKYGKKFCREGAGRGVPAVDEQRLQALLGERWLQACDETVVPAVTIPEHIEYRLSIEKVLDLAQSDPEVLEALRTCLIPGKAKTPRFTVRDL